MAQIELRGISKTYGKNTIIKHLDLVVPDGTFLVIVGPSGCGKSTILRLIAGLEDLSGGDIYIGNTCVNKLEPKARNIAMVFQNYALYPHMTVRENICYGLKMQKIPKEEQEKRLNIAAEMLGLQDFLDRQPRQLSGGQRQRVAMGRAIVREPSAFLFDEPLSNLDAALRNQMRVELRRLHQRLGTTSVYVTHDQVEAMTLAERILIMNKGEMEQFGTPEELYSYPASLFVAQFIGSPSMNVFQTHFKDGVVTLPNGNKVPKAPSSGQVYSKSEGELYFGVRPEDLILLPEATEHSLSCAVELTEALGADTLVHCTIQGYTAPDASFFVARLDNSQKPKVGDILHFGIKEGHAHLFDKDTGKRL